MKMRKKIRLGHLLVERKEITQTQLQEALSIQRKTGGKLGRVLIEHDYISEDKLLNILANQLNIQFIDLKRYHLYPEIVRLIPENHARRFRAIAIEETDKYILVGMADPTDIFAYDEICRLLKKNVKLAVVREADLLHIFNTVYRRTEEISNFAEQLGEELFQRDVDLQEMSVQDNIQDAPVVKLLQSLFEDALQVHASDIHIEPDEAVLRIRQRVDGILHEQLMPDKRIAPALVLRLKLMAGLDIAEKRLPQDGRFSLKVTNNTIDVRISTLPTQHGETVVLRLLDHSKGLLNLEQLGMPEDVLAKFKKLLKEPNGMIIVTGQTGSGKTTTLYAALNALNRAENKIITVEDPVEYRLPRVNQVQVHSDIGLSFSRVLRSALRQDPDVVLVGEMRDEETVEIGLRAAMTGHLVLSTLHTNDAISSANRLLDMEAKGYLIGSSLRAILAQRLLRRVCPHCKHPYIPSPQQKIWLKTILGHNIAQKLQFQHGKGCTHCHNTGYYGRIGVFELLEIDEKLSDLLAKNDTLNFAKVARQQDCYQSIAHSALKLATQGITTLEEAERIGSQLEEGIDLEEKPCKVTLELA